MLKRPSLMEGSEMEEEEEGKARKGGALSPPVIGDNSRLPT